MLYVFRALLFFMMEGFFNISDITKGAKLRKQAYKEGNDAMKKLTPKKYWDMLTPDFDIGAKRRIFDSVRPSLAVSSELSSTLTTNMLQGYLKVLGRDNVELLETRVDKFTENSVITEDGQELPADVIVLCTGFRVQEFLFPLSIVNGEGESLRERFKTSNVSSYQCPFFNSILSTGFLLTRFKRC